MSAVAPAPGASLADLLGEFYAAGLPLTKSSIALAASLVGCGESCYLTAFTVLNTNAAAQFIQLHDSRTLPGNGAVPTVSFTVPGSSDKTVSYALPGLKFLAGVVIANSSTSATLTIGSADCFFNVQSIPVVPG